MSLPESLACEPKPQCERHELALIELALSSSQRKDKTMTDTTLLFDAQQIPSNLSEKSFIGDILIAYGFCNREKVDDALTTQSAERSALTNEDRAASKRGRFTGEILVDNGAVSQSQVDFGMIVQNFLRAAK